MSRVLGIFAKQPVPGRVKTRLAAATSPEYAARLAEAFLLDQLDAWSTLHLRRVLVYDPPEARPYFESIAQQSYELVPQIAGDLGQRMQGFLSQAFQGGANKTVLVGADSPGLPIEFIVQAFADLEEADVVLGPAHDGGYYLLGAAQQFPQLFEGISWGTSQVLAQTRAVIERNKLRASLLPAWYDIDELADVHKLRSYLAAGESLGANYRLPRTWKLLQ